MRCPNCMNTLTKSRDKTLTCKRHGIFTPKSSRKASA